MKEKNMEVKKYKKTKKNGYDRQLYNVIRLMENSRNSIMVILSKKIILW